MWPPETSGSWADWVAGLATVVAVLFAFVQLAAVRRSARRDQAERDAAARRLQASLIAAWTDRMGVPVQEDVEMFRQLPSPPDDFDAIRWIAVVRIRNVSDAPVYELRYAASAGVRGTAVGYLAVLPPTSTAEVLVPFPAPPRSDWIGPAVAFKDAHGRGWWRQENGELIEGEPTSGAFDADPGAYESQDRHPTLSISHPYRLMGEDVHPRSGRVTLKE